MPEVLTEVDEQPAQSSNADLCRAAQAHYDKVSTAAHEWHSAIPKAIDAYYKDAERSRLEREVIEKAKAYGRANQAIEDHMKKSSEAGSDPRDGWQELRDLESTWEEMLLEAIKPLLDFEAKQK